MEYITIYAFNGINRQVSPFLSDEGEVSESQNLVTDKIGSLEKSFDYSQKGDTISNYSIVGALDFYRNDGSHDHFLSADGTSEAEIFKYDGSSWVSQEQNLTNDSTPRFVYSPTIDVLFSFNYDDATRSWDGTNWSTTDEVTDAPKAKYGLSWGDRIYLFNCKVGGTSFPSRAYRSNAIETSTTWDTADYITFEDTITGVGVNGENQFITCQNSTYIFTLDDSKYKISNIGGVSHDGIASYGTDTYYPAPDGYYVFNGSSTQKISLPIQEYWNEISEDNWENIQAKVLGNHLYIYVGDITAPWDSSETMQNVVFDYNILQQNWNRGRLGTDCTNLHTFVTPLGKRMFYGDDTGKLYQLFDGSGQQDGNDYASFVETNWIYGSGARFLDDYKELYGFGEYLSGLEVSYKKEERDDWKTIGTLNEDTDIIKFKDRAYKIKFRLAEISGKNLYRLDRLDVGYQPAMAKDTDATR